jgi:S-DNA-T family DNA segregation ATPase FtsK/SpoIIIE
MVVRRNPKRRLAEKESTQESISPWARTWINEFLAIALSIVAIFLASALTSNVLFEQLSKDTNLMGPSGHLISTMLVGFMGLSSFVVVALLCAASFYLWRLDLEPASKPSLSSICGFMILLLSFSALAALIFGTKAGGVWGSSVAEPLRRFLGSSGATLVIFGFAVVGASLFFKVSAYFLIKGFFARIFQLCRASLVIPVLLWGACRGIVPVLWERFVFLIFGAPDPQELERIRKEQEQELKESKRFEKENEVKVVESFKKAADKRLAARVEKVSVELEEEVDEEIDEDVRVVVSRKSLEANTKRREFVRVLDDGESSQELVASFQGYQLPALSLLTPSEAQTGAEDDEHLLRISGQIEAKLRDFGILGKVTEVHPGPVITLYEFEPAAGVKVGKIAALADDLAMGLKASSIRIVAPIPKKGTVGIEVPNKNRDLVHLRDVLESDAFVNSDSILSISLGKDTYGDPVVMDLASMPHLLIAGSTGTGKSVCINTILLSLLYRASPAELGLIMIDPKILELSVYEGIPHLRVPVVTQPRGAKAVLQWAVDEMHRRYRYIQKFGVRNIDGYNKLVSGEDLHDSEITSDTVAPIPTSETKAESYTNSESSALSSTANDAESTKEEPFKEKLKPLPKIVIVIDEVADLMLSVGREIEELITRLAQKARAAGIHLIIATQRPSVDVITGLIKANFPARLSFRVSSRIDSRTILDSMGAEKLLGKGDMLMMLPAAEGLRRIHGAFVSDNEVKRVAKVVKDQAGPQYDARIMNVINKAIEDAKKEQEASDSSGTGTGSTEDYDDIYDKAVELVVEKGYASTSMVQRVFRIGYNRAARIIELMEKEGVVGPMDGAKPREVLVPNRTLESTN